MQPTTATVKSFTFTPEEASQFQRDGYFGPFKVYEVEEMKSLWKQERLRLLDCPSPAYQDEVISGNTSFAGYDRHLDSAFLADHICRPEIVDRVCGALGPDVLCWRTELLPKYSGDEGTDWHQADTFAHASGRPQILWPGDHKAFGGAINVWTAFTEATVDMACLQFIPGTYQALNYDETKRMHYNPAQTNQKTKDGVHRGFYGYDYSELRKDPNWKPDESKAVSMVMRPGEGVMFWSTLMHASHPHAGKTKEMRLGFVGRYVPTCVQVYPGTDVLEEYGRRIKLDKYGAVLVAGEDRYGHNRIARATTSGKPFNRRVSQS